jgi:hypothetical protein
MRKGNLARIEIIDRIVDYRSGDLLEFLGIGKNNQFYLNIIYSF